MDPGAPRPEISAVVASFSGEAALARCLASLEPQAAELGAEVVVASNASPDDLSRLRAAHPGVRVVACPGDSSVFALRSAGVEESRGALVALTEDHVTVAPRWLAALAAARAAGHGIAGGPVDNGLRRRAYDWALYFCEYGVYMPPLPPGPAPILSGINVAYDRELLERTASLWRRELRENEIHAALAGDGVGLHAVPEAAVTSHLAMALPEAMDHLFQGGRTYGRWRRTLLPPGKRLLLAAAAPLVPVVLLLRIASRTASRQPRLLAHLFLGLPFFVPLLLAWSAGEAAGYWSSGARPEAAR